MAARQGRHGRQDGARRARRLAFVLLAMVLGGLAISIRPKLEWRRPHAELVNPVEALGVASTIEVRLSDPQSGLHWSRLEIESGGARTVLASEQYPATFWGGGEVRATTLSVPLNAAERRIPEGPATLWVFAEDRSWLRWFRAQRAVLEQRVTIDLTPPTIEILSQQHYLKLGGVDFILYRVSPDSTRSGIAVDRYFFPGTRGLFADPAIAAAFFAVPQDLDTRATPKAVAEDAAGNRREVDFHAVIKPRRFADRTLDLDDAFLARKVPTLLSSNRLPPTSTLLDGYLLVNRTLRQASEERIRELTRTSAPAPLWNGSLLRQPNSAPLSGFGDRRSYRYGGKIVDAQVHLGYDLASLRQSPVPAANNGRVVFVGELGIYGDVVIVDHGLGIFSLYGHLSAVTAAVGQDVQRGTVIGRTGETGLAGGDHLHFSVMLYGTHVDPVEWWDGKWIRDHVDAKLALYPRAAAAADGSDVPGAGT